MFSISCREEWQVHVKKENSEISCYLFDWLAADGHLAQLLRCYWSRISSSARQAWVQKGSASIGRRGSRLSWFLRVRNSSIYSCHQDPGFIQDLLPEPLLPAEISTYHIWVCRLNRCFPWSPVRNSVFSRSSHGWISINRGEQVKEDVKRNLVPALVLGGVIWPALLIANSHFVPARYQLVFVSLFAFSASVLLVRIEQ